MGKGLTPVAAYLAQDDIIRIALEHGVDMIHPGCVCLGHARALALRRFLLLTPCDLGQIWIPL